MKTEKRIYYVSRFTRPLTQEDLDEVRESSKRNNPQNEVTGFLVCLGETLFQALEGPEDAVDRLYHERILKDPRHTGVRCLKNESGITERLFKGWNMEVFDLNRDAEILPMAFREMLRALLDSHRTLAEYTQSSLLKMLEQGVNPASVQPRRRDVTVLYCDMIWFSLFAERLSPESLLGLVNSQIEVCAQVVHDHGGEVNKVTGDAVLAYFPGKTSDPGLKSAIAIVEEMRRRRARADRTSPHHYLYSGVGLAHGLVYEGNLGGELKRDFTILGNTVNLAARLEALTRELQVRLTLAPSVVRHAEGNWEFKSLKTHRIRGQSSPVEVFTLSTLPRLDVARVRAKISEMIPSGR